jgi:hypothetical protein
MLKNHSIKYLIIPLLLCACTTPKTILKNESTGQIAICGGTANGSFAGGIIGYHVQKANDEDCVNDYKSEGFSILKSENNNAQ